ncbi:hypothetical protein [Magnetospirillum gryphiswaldense]|uniref:hypothetical protein n=1 Tax=Magnetospirillum gryphiswaldense TaxID=55518 RepID=UPI000D03CDA6|nr:hypothetical protein [Magnetospirillum gryphiswaldense]AVM73390.1 hypothetical protein MSR1_08870 [Magnetospirillum gryphiswaldense MSR-1]AVM77293.1 hypothetical protein MSR1L_08870 [Magnetospirillum gryphiswaldense]
MAFINGLPEDEREALEQGFRERLATGVVPAIVAKRFKGGETWCADPIIRREALDYFKFVRPDFAVRESEMSVCEAIIKF